MAIGQTKAVYLPAHAVASFTAAVREEIAFGDSQGTRFDIIPTMNLMSEADFNFIYSLPPLEELGLEKVPWVSHRFSIRWIAAKSQAYSGTTVYLNISPIGRDVTARPMLDIVSAMDIRIIVRDENEELVKGTKLPGVAYAEFILNAKRDWAQYQVFFDATDQTDDNLRGDLYRFTRTQLYLALESNKELCRRYGETP